jgi:hypothetical protein
MRVRFGRGARIVFVVGKGWTAVAGPAAMQVSPLRVTKDKGVTLAPQRTEERSPGAPRFGRDDRFEVGHKYRSVIRGDEGSGKNK